MADIFHKTPLGFEEIVGRKHGLTPRMRRCLIMVDGKRSLSELMTTLQGEDITPLIQALEIEGFIELIGTSNTPITQNGATLNIGNSTVMSTTQFSGFPESQPLFTDSTGQLRKPLQFEERKIRASRVVNELLGPSAETIALKIEKTKDAAALELVLQVAASFISESVNAVAAKRFRDHVRLKDPTSADA